MFINPWAFYHPDDIPNLTPHDDEEMVGCLAGACGAIVSRRYAKTNFSFYR